MMAKFLLLFVLLSYSSAFTTNRIVSFRSYVSFLAAKKGGKGNSGGKGFKKQPQSQAYNRAMPAITTFTNDDDGDSVDGNAPTMEDVDVDLTSPVESKEILGDAEAVFKKYGIASDRNAKETMKNSPKITEQVTRSGEAAFGEAIMANIPMKTQQQIDSILITGVFIALSYLLACGIGISAGALKVVFPDVDIPSWAESLIANQLTPSFTPALGVFFLFSITLGLFKFAQVSSSQTVYRED